MSRPRMRPNFTVELECTGEQLMDAFRRHLVIQAEDVEGKFSVRHGVLRIPEEKSHFWTPCLDLTIEDREAAESDRPSGHSKLWGTFSPRAEIWTGFVFAIGTLVVVSVFSTVYGIAQVALGRPPWALSIPVFALILSVLLYVSALVGQGLSISEMYRLRAFVDDCLREAEREAAEGTRLRKRPRSVLESSQL